MILKMLPTMMLEKIHTMLKIKNWKEHWTNTWPDDSKTDNNDKPNIEDYLSKMAQIKFNLDDETEVLKQQRADFISMVNRLQRGQENIYQEKYKQLTVENYIETLKDQIVEISRELSKRGK